MDPASENFDPVARKEFIDRVKLPAAILLYLEMDKAFKLMTYRITETEAFIDHVDSVISKYHEA